MSRAIGHIARALWQQWRTDADVQSAKFLAVCDGVPVLLSGKRDAALNAKELAPLPTVAQQLKTEQLKAGLTAHAKTQITLDAVRCCSLLQ